MDMKRILQALDHAETKPVVGQDDMKKFLQVVTEGASPHKVALPVQMAMQHYQQPQAQVTPNKSPIKTSVRKFFREVEVEHTEKLAEKKQLLRQYSQTIADRVLMREFKERPDDESNFVYKDDNPNVKGALTKARTQAAGTRELSLNETVLNYLATKEGFPNWIEAKKILDESEFIDLVQRAVKLIKQLKENEIPGHSMGFKPGPGSPGMQSNTPDGGHLGLGEKMSSKKTLKNSNPCWTGYHPVGTKKKGGRTVPNCVPTSKK
jgi:hypothetical protein